MYCTAGFLHATGKTVTLEGEIVSADAANEQAVYEFVSIEARCGADGITPLAKSGKALQAMDIPRQRQV
jgi:hypothetical protein